MSDVVVYGATGYVGVLVAEYLAAHAPAGTSVALAGRSSARLAEVRARIGRDWPVIVADAADPAAMQRLASGARVVLSTVGPYAKYGKPLVHACAAAGTDYVDLTGEVLFVRDSAAQNHDLARSTGARIVHSCGFDSIPSDLGVHLLHAKASADGAGGLTDTTLVVTRLRGGLSGGTIDSIRNQVDVLKKDPALRRVVGDPYALSPNRDKEPDLGRQPDLDTLPAAEIDPDLRGRLAPFVMAPYNTRIVRRSNALRDWAYGRRFRYREAMRVGGWPLLAQATKAGLGGLVLAMALPPTRFVADRLLPKPGQGPSERTRRTGHFTVDLFTTTESGKRYTARVRADGDPGYAATAVMISESALALALAERSSEGGVLTPATGIGDALVQRLRAAGLELTVVATTSAK
jgi:short subunit dehydrogenase-like uncharacterized protein